MSKTEVIIILDMSGSMYSLTKDTIGGCNSLLAEQRKDEEDEVNVTIVLFNDKYHKFADRVPLKDVKDLTDKDYIATGTTALYDAVGKTITEFPEVDKDTKVILSITTDGMENSSYEFTRKTVKTLLEDKQKLGWEVMFIGANIDAAEEAVSMGIRPERAAQYIPDGEGTGMVFKAMSASVMSVRKAGRISDDWKRKLDEDFKNRSKD